ncbi:MAG: cation-transporting P-type ATPase, partial [Oscillospiraceae bacterium]|nr:cation-transporting P-type ATPase [Oscillospiraceae bacterium]
MKITHHHSKDIINKNSLLEQEYKSFAGGAGEDILKKMNTADAGLTETEAGNRLEANGKNTTSDTKLRPWYIFLLKSFLDEFIIVLLLLGIVSIFMG